MEELDEVPEGNLSIDYCGDGVCNPDEDCSLCSDDCGDCPADDNDTPGYNTYISEGKVYWEFTDLQGTRQKWSIPIDTYTSYASSPKNIQTLTLRCGSCDDEMLLVVDYRPFVQPEFFEGIIYTLTDGRTDKEFVDEVFNLKRQLMVYELTNESAQWSAETLTEGQGSCRDSAVLMASLLEAGNRHANYSMEIKFMYLDIENIEEPRIMNHIILHLKYADGSEELLETTADENVEKYTDVFGWRVDIIADMCSDRTIYGGCSGINKGWYCNNGDLVYNCDECEC